MAGYKRIGMVAGLLLIIFSLASPALSQVTAENFENYTAGNRLCTQAPVYWYTWNNAPGTAEDPKVTDSIAFQGNKSLLITGTNDVLLNLNGKTTGRYEIAFYLRIPPGKVGFYGLLSRFAGNESIWGLQCHFDAANTGTVDADGKSIDFNFNHNQWIPVRNIIDLDNDHAEIYINGTLVIEGKWSSGLPGVPGLSRLDAANFFAWNAEQRQPEMFLDSLVYRLVPPPDPPRNLAASVNINAVNLSWAAPVSGTPSGYRVYRDSVIISPLLTTFSYVDAGVYPGEYRYAVKAVYGSGMSLPAGPVDIVVQGGTARKQVLLEIATGTWCTFCPGASMGADDLLNNGKDVAVIEYHDNDDYANADADYRNATYYHVPGFPTAHFDGGNEIAAGNAMQTMYPVYLPVYTQRIPKRSLFTIQMNVNHTGTNEVKVTLKVQKIYPYSGSNLRLHLVLTESHIPKTWQTIMHEVNFVCRKMYPDHNGTAADFTGDSIVTLNYTVPIDTSYNFSNCELVAFLQDNLTREVLQTEKVKLGSLGMNDLQDTELSVFPNPASDILFIKSKLPVLQFRILDLSGRNMMASGPGKSEMQLDISFLLPGIYFLYIKTASGVVIKKLMIT